MSPTMLLGRVCLPLAGVFVAGALIWQFAQTRIARPAELPFAGLASATTRIDGRISAEGRVAVYPGAEVTMSSEVLGTIVTIPVREKGAVHKGDLLVELRSDEVKAELREAHHRLTEAEVSLRLEQARTALDRMLPLATGRESQQPETRRDLLTAAAARRDAARAAVERLQAEAAKYRITAPIDGVVLARYADPGETVSPASPLITIVDLTRLCIEAEVDEFDIGGIAVAQKATITAEGYPGHRWRGEVEEIADAVVARQTRPQDPGSPSDTRVLLVKIGFKEPNPLKLGQRVEIDIAGKKREPARTPVAPRPEEGTGDRERGEPGSGS